MSMAAILAFALCATLAADAAVNPWSEDFTGLGAPPPGMVLGAQQYSGTAGTTTVAGGAVNWSENDYRQFVGCTDQDYFNSDFTAYATVTMNGTTAYDSIYFGITTDYDVAGWSPEGIGGYMGIDPRGTGGQMFVNQGSGGQVFASGLAAGTHRLRIQWDAGTTNVIYAIDADYTGGTFTADYLGTNSNSSITDAMTAYLFFGGGSGCIFDDISVGGLAPPVEMVSFSPVSENMMQAVLLLPDTDTSYYPMATTNLVDGAWSRVAHSHTNDAGTFVVTNLAYSSVDASSNKVIYLQADADARFFRIPWDTPVDRTFPILAWCGPPSDLLTDAAWADMANAGFNLCFPYFIDSESHEKGFALGEKYGVGMFARDTRIEYDGVPQSQVDIEAAVLEWMDYPALAGYALGDEPSADEFAEFARIKGIVEGVDAGHRAYVNLFPGHGSLGTNSYAAYVAGFMATFSPDVLSYDHYPISTSGIRATFYNDMEIIRAEALAADVPFSAFTLSIPHWSYPTPTEGHLRFQLYTALAYGARELQYFTYADVVSLGGGPGLIDTNGNKTATYYMASEINWEIQRMGPVLLDLDSTAVFHTAPIPDGTQMFTGYGGLESFYGGLVVLGFFEDSVGQAWVMVVNRSPDSVNEGLILTFSADVDSVEELDRSKEGGVLNPVELIDQKFELNLMPGDGRLFRISTM